MINLRLNKTLIGLSSLAVILAMASCTPKRVNPFLEDWDTPYGIPPFDKIEYADYPII